MTQNQRRGSELPSQTNSPITMLHLDILREIFLSNADIFVETKALEITRRSSQVCHAWRTLILNSPTIWGRLLDLSALARSTERWKEEVLNRSGNSLLWVCGRASGCLTHSRLGTEFFYRILGAHWERIQHLSIIITDLPFDEQLWRPLLKPAPYLQSLLVVPLKLRREYLFSTANSSTPATPLFSNHAPMLRDFSTQGVAFSLTSPWLSHLRNLRLSLSFSVSEILDALHSIPSLMTLTISADKQRPLVSTSLSSVTLANLTSLNLNDIWLPNVTQFLTHIRPSDGCSLFCTSEFSSNVNEDLQALPQPLSGWFQNYLRNHHVTALHLDFGSAGFWIYDNTSHTDIDLVFRMVVTRPAMQPLPLDSYDFFPSSFSSCDFSTVTQLTMTIPHLPPSSFTAFTPLFSSFPSVTDLSADEQTIFAILSSPIFTENAEAAEPSPLFFPLLQTLRTHGLEERHPDSGASNDYVRPLLRFLRTRVAFGVPILTLDIGEISQWADLDMTSLEEMAGLLVMWYTNDEYFNYTCGSGKPESLLFTATGVDF
ncbi:hypothetical protein GALMADRAFT_258308 [Galerina marginata CBS 339.88]|uniref:F-box domain-containing protein n=1 Tax=Galerina marginata (strain CBS 339.88) TaxID=685588 RepID=A0A067SHZ0_GALM3|nr:hypothetical protein GALMADRAFT_258308 [Galerina marginata CBS 339.88]